MRIFHPSWWAQAWVVTLTLFAFMPVGNAAAPAETAIVVAAVQGDVRVTMRGELRAVRAGSVLDLPATIASGDDASIALRQGGTTITVAANTALDVPMGITESELLERVVQRSGNALYNVAPRVSRKLRVETAYLVAVIKGTQFNVAVQNESTTVSLFEGVLEIRTPGGEDIVTLNAGEIAVRRSADTSIRVLSMDTGDVLRGAAVSPPPTTFTTPPDAVLASTDANASATGGQLAALVDDRAPQQPTAALSGNESSTTAGDANIIADVIAKPDGAPMMETDIGVNIDASGITAGVSATTDLGAVSLGVDTAISLEGGAVGVDAGIDLGALGISASVGADASIDLGSGLTASVGAEAGLPIADVGADIGAGITAGTDGVGLDVGADITAGSIDVPITVDVGATPSGGIDAGVDVGGLGIDIGIGGDSGLIDLDLTPSTPSTPPSGGGGGGGGLLGGLRGLLGG